MERSDANNKYQFQDQVTASNCTVALRWHKVMLYHIFFFILTLTSIHTLSQQAPQHPKNARIVMHIPDAISECVRAWTRLPCGETWAILMDTNKERSTCNQMPDTIIPIPVNWNSKAYRTVDLWIHAKDSYRKEYKLTQIWFAITEYCSEIIKYSDVLRFTVKIDGESLTPSTYTPSSCIIVSAAAQEVKKLS